MGKTPLPVQGPGFHPWSGSWLQHAPTEEPRASARMEGSECGNEDPEEQKKKFPFKIMRKLTIRISFSITEANCCGRIAPIARGASFATVAFPDVSILLGAGGAFPGDARGKEPACRCRRPREEPLTPGQGRSPGGGHDSPL